MIAKGRTGKYNPLIRESEDAGVKNQVKLALARMLPGADVFAAVVAVVVISALIILHRPDPAIQASPVAQEKPAAAPTAPSTEAPSAPATNLPIQPTAAPSADAKAEGIWRKVVNNEPEMHERTLVVNSCTYNVTCLRASCTVSLAYRNLDNSDPLYLPFATCRARGTESAMNAIIRGMGRDVEADQ